MNIKKLFLGLVLLSMLAFSVNAEVVLNMTFDSSDGIYNSTFAENLAGYGNSSFVNATYYNDSNCYSGGCYRFRGTLIKFAGADWNNITENITMITRIKRLNEAYTSEVHKAILTKQNTLGYGFYLSNSTNNFVPYFWYKNESTTRTVSSLLGMTYFFEKYFELGFSVDQSAKKVYYYINGDLMAEQDYNGGTFNGTLNDLLIGAYANVAGTLNFFSNIYLDSIYLINESYSDQQHQDFYLSETPGKTLIFNFGDSITGSTKEKLYPTLIGQEVDYYTRNVAVGGYTLKDSIENSLPIFNSNTDNFDYATILLGTNNVETLNESIFYDNYTEIVNNILNKGTTPILSTIPPSNITTRHENETLVNNIIRRISYNNNTCYNDIYHNVFNDVWSESMFKDDIHPKLEIQVQSLLNSSFIESINNCESFYFCDLSPSDCYQGITLVGNNPYIESHTSYVEDASYTSGEFTFSCEVDSGNTYLTNLLSIASASGYVDVYHNGIFVESINTDTYTTTSCSEWSFRTSRLVAQEFKDQALNPMLGAFGIIALTIVVAAGFALVKAFESGDGTAIAAVASLAIGLAIVLIIGAYILGNVSTIVP